MDTENGESGFQTNSQNTWQKEKCTSSFITKKEKKINAMLHLVPQL